MTRIVLAMALGVVVALAVGWAIVAGVPRSWRSPPGGAPAAQAAPPRPETAGRRIRVTLYYVSEDGMRLIGVDREAPYGEGPLEQARLLVEELLKPAPAPLAQALPEGTSLRALFLTPSGEAIVDLSKELTARHGGGSLDELFSVYAVVNALTVNLPAVTSVQILVDGREADTLAGHVDLRQPLRKNLKWVETP